MKITASATRISALSTQIANQFFELATLAAKTVWAEYAANTPNPGFTPVKRARGRPSNTTTISRAARANGNPKGSTMTADIVSSVINAGRGGMTYEALCAALPQYRTNHLAVNAKRLVANGRLSVRNPAAIDRGPWFGPSKSTSSKAQQPGVQPGA